MVVMSITPLREMRTAFGLSQEDMARAAGITLQTYRNAESGKNCTYTTATLILSALNAKLQAHNQAAVSLETLGLKIV